MGMKAYRFGVLVEPDTALIMMDFFPPSLLILLKYYGLPTT
jgi:hypothetical protein